MVLLGWPRAPLQVCRVILHFGFERARPQSPWIVSRGSSRLINAARPTDTDRVNRKASQLIPSETGQVLGIEPRVESELVRSPLYSELVVWADFDATLGEGYNA